MIDVRYATTNDLDDILKLDDEITIEDIKKKIEDKEYFILKSEDEVVGILRYNKFLDCIPMINKITIMDEYNNDNNFKKLIELVEMMMRINNKSSEIMVLVNSNDTRQELYRENGYIDIGALKLNYFDRLSKLSLILVKEL